MLKPFVVYYDSHKCTKIEGYSTSDLAQAAADKVLDAAEPARTALVVYALSREDLERDPAHRIGAELADNGDGVTDDLD
jgi:hypothetical protein